MTAEIEQFEARAGGHFRVSLAYDDPTQQGKSGGSTDTYSGHFVDLEPDRRVVEVMQFESPDPALAGTMTVTTTLRDADGGTEVQILHEGVPDAVPVADNETGQRMALGKPGGVTKA